MFSFQHPFFSLKNSLINTQQQNCFEIFSRVDFISYHDFPPIYLAVISTLSCCYYFIFKVTCINDQIKVFFKGQGTRPSLNPGRRRNLVSERFSFFYLSQFMSISISSCWQRWVLQVDHPLLLHLVFQAGLVLANSPPLTLLPAHTWLLALADPPPTCPARP